MSLSSIHICSLIKNATKVTQLYWEDRSANNTTYSVDLETFPALAWFEICVLTNTAGAVQIMSFWRYQIDQLDGTSSYQLDILNDDTPLTITKKLNNLFDHIRKGTLISNLDD